MLPQLLFVLGVNLSNLLSTKITDCAWLEVNTNNSGGAKLRRNYKRTKKTERHWLKQPWPLGRLWGNCDNGLGIPFEIRGGKYKGDEINYYTQISIHITFSLPISMGCILIQGVSKRVLRWYPKCYCVANITKTFALKAYKLSIVRDVERLVGLYAFKCYCFRNTRHTVTFGIPL
jgi:hypothetical protein